MDGNVPTIDISPWFGGEPAARDNVARNIADACENWGFFLLTGHGIPTQLMDSVAKISKLFFDQPEEEKLRLDAVGNPTGRGYYRMEAKSLARTLGDASAPGDLRESFRIGAEPQAESPITLADAAAGHFAANIWPSIPAEMRAIWSQYFDLCDTLAGEVLRICARALGLPDMWFDDKIDHASSSMVAQHYPMLTTEPVPGQLRNGAHTDFGTLTLLMAEDRPGGLQVMGLDGSWHDVRPVSGAYIVNLGDMMAQWTNDRWRSTLHRVVNPPHDAGGAARRLSIVFFHAPNYDAQIACIPTCTDAAHPVKYPSYLAGAHVAGKLKAVESVAQEKMIATMS